ncbi:ATP-binding protein [Kitasatospora sp. NPDC051914]|uniref:ATP-binding protein n=1 Tax=Kitasatospora sp. NPDC051914 TaxID=3154945 RepID=UPI003443218A
MCPLTTTPAHRHRRLAFPPGDRKGCVRRGIDFTRLALADWRPDADAVVVDDVLLVAAELLANAVDHAGGPVVMDLRLAPRARRMRIEVADASPARPRIRPARPEEPHHRGLRIVDHIAAAWGSRPDGTGKTVWAALRLP